MKKKGKRRYLEKKRAKRRREEAMLSFSSHDNDSSQETVSPEIQGALFATGLIKLPDDYENDEDIKTDESTEKRESKPLFITLTVLVTLLTAIAVLIFTAVNWVFKTWTNLSMKELTFHLQSNLEGTNSDYISSFLVSTLPFVLIAACIIAAALIILRHKKIRQLYNIITRVGIVVLSFSIISISVYRFWTELDVGAYTASASEKSDFIADNYVDPSDVNVTFPEKKRNLIYIFLESMENTFSDKENGGAFKEDVIPELTSLSEKNENFSGSTNKLNGGIPLEGGTWTVAAMFSQTSGLPLLIPIDENDMNTQSDFFPGITALGDILESAGYNQSIMFGSDAAFGGRDKYFTSHGDYNMFDYYYAYENGLIPKNYKVFWGYEDDKLFEIAKEKLTQESKEDKPFNFTMLTVDTHFEDGYVCKDCPNTFDDQYSNVYACSSKKVSEFVKWIQQQDFYDNTTVVLVGDHLTMDSDFCDDVSDDYTRTVYTDIINGAATPETNEKREYSTLDMFPTTLAALGVNIEGNRLGLGTNLYSSEQTLVEKHGADKMNEEFLKQSDFMDELTSTIRKSYEYDETQAETKEETTKKLSKSVTVEKGPYDYRNECFDINISNIPDDFITQIVQVAVWSKADQSDLRWYECSPMDDGSFQTRVNASDFGNEPGTYNIYVYFIDEKGEAYNSTQLTAEM